MPKFDIELTLFRTVEAKNIDEAEAIAAHEKAHIVLWADKNGWQGAATRIAHKPERKISHTTRAPRTLRTPDKFE